MNLPSTCRGSGRCPKTGSTLRGVCGQTRTDSTRPSRFSAAALSRFVGTHMWRSGGCCSSWESVLWSVASQRSTLLPWCSLGHLHPCQQAVGHHALQSPTPADRPVFPRSSSGMDTRTALSLFRLKHGSWLPIFDHEVAHRCRAVHVGRAPAVITTMLERPAGVAIKHVALQPWIHLFSQTVIVDQTKGCPWAACSLFAMCLNVHMEGR